MGVAAAFLLFFTPPAAAQKDRERPLQEVFETELVYAQDRAEVQVTSGFRARWWKDVHLYQLPLQMEYGLTDNWQGSLSGKGPRDMPRAEGR